MKNYLKETRVQMGLTQAELADAVQVSRQTIISIETSRYIPSIVLSLKLARHLGKKVEEIFELEKKDYG